MNSVFVKERYAYSKEELHNIFPNNTENCIRRLKEYGILKAIKSNEDKDLSDLEDLEMIVDESDTDCYHVFTFVGVIIIDGYVLKCYPKYIFRNDSPLEELKQVIQVLERMNSKERIIEMYINNQQDKRFNRLAAIIYFINDYYENGIYFNTKDIIETNGNGEINWNKTVNETFAIISDNRPYYTELQTLKHKNDEYDYFKRLHECILTVSSKELIESSLSDLFGYEEIEITEETISDFGDKEYILYRLEKEMSVQFNTRKLQLLDAMHSFIADEGILTDDSALSLYGTNSFHTIWESVIKKVFDDKLNTPLRSLNLPQPLSTEYYPDDTLKSIIEKPQWIDSIGKSHIPKNKKTLEPDIISIKDDLFVIMDAKYYNLVLDPINGVSGNPGVGDVTKQYLYQLAYRDFIQKHGFSKIKNCFLMPTEGEEIVSLGTAKMEMLEKLCLENIQIRLLPARQMYSLYLASQTTDVCKLEL